jgi:hypothetical protein
LQYLPLYQLFVRLNQTARLRLLVPVAVTGGRHRRPRDAVHIYVDLKLLSLLLALAALVSRPLFDLLAPPSLVGLLLIVPFRRVVSLLLLWRVLGVSQLV